MDLRIGVIGYGLRSGLVRLAHRPGEGSGVLAVGDRRAERRDLAGAVSCGGMVALETVDELLNLDLDAVF